MIISTVGTNHFGHFYLHHLLLPRIQPQDGRIVVTASGVHDPASPGGAQGPPAFLGNLQGLEQQGRSCEMLDGGAYNPDKAYKDSKVRYLEVDDIPSCLFYCINDAISSFATFSHYFLYNNVVRHATSCSLVSFKTD
jgi:hypothetical protein